MRPSVLILSLALLCGCNRDVGKGRDVDGPGKDDPERVNPVEDVGKFMKELKELKPVDPVHFDKLAPFLPAPPAGYKKTKEPEKTTLAVGEVKYTRVVQEYQRDDEKSFTVTIDDWAHHPSLYVSFASMPKMNVEQGPKSIKTMTVDGNPGTENYDKMSRQGEMHMLVARRFFVAITADDVKEGFTRSVYDSIDLKKLSALK